MEKRKVTVHRNDLERFLMKVRDYIKEHRSSTITIIIALVAGLALFIAGSIYFEKQSFQNQRAYEKIITAYENSARDDAAFATAVGDLQKAIDKSKWGYLHNNGGYILAGLYFEHKKYADAEKYYLAFADSNDSSVFAPLAIFQAGVCREEQGNAAKALELYKRVEKDYSKTLFMDRALYDIARMSQVTGDIANAKEYYNRLMSQYPASPFVQQAKTRMLLIGIKAQ